MSRCVVQEPDRRGAFRVPGLIEHPADLSPLVRDLRESIHHVLVLHGKAVLRFPDRKALVIGPRRYIDAQRFSFMWRVAAAREAPEKDDLIAHIVRQGKGLSIIRQIPSVSRIRLAELL